MNDDDLFFFFSFTAHDQTLRVWDFETGKLLQTIEGHTGAISCLSLQDDVVLTGSWDKSIRIWDLRSQKPEIGVVSNAHKDKILCLQCDVKKKKKNINK